MLTSHDEVAATGDLIAFIDYDAVAAARAFLSATNSGFATTKIVLHWAIAKTMLRVRMTE